jgi:RNA polymerase sigma factor (sigma-70 family)
MGGFFAEKGKKHGKKGATPEIWFLLNMEKEIQDPGQIYDLALNKLGPATRDFLKTSKGESLLKEQMSEHQDLLDQVLGVAFSMREESPAIWGEFLNFFFRAIPSGRIQGSPSLRSHTCTDDMRVSIIHAFHLKSDDFSFKGAKATMVWLKKCLNWKSMNLARKIQNRKNETLSSVGRQDLESRGKSPEQVLLEAEEDILLGISFGRLPSKDRELIKMALEGMSRAKMAEHFGVTTQTVSKRLSRATKRLHQGNG